MLLSGFWKMAFEMSMAMQIWFGHTYTPLARSDGLMSKPDNTQELF